MGALGSDLISSFCHFHVHQLGYALARSSGTASTKQDGKANPEPGHRTESRTSDSSRPSEQLLPQAAGAARHPGMLTGPVLGKQHCRRQSFRAFLGSILSVPQLANFRVLETSEVFGHGSILDRNPVGDYA